MSEHIGSNRRAIFSALAPCRAAVAIIASLLACASAHATPISVNPANINILDTGYGLNGSPVGTIDPNWTVSLLSTGNAGGTGGTPPGGIPGGAIGAVTPAYLVPNSYTNVTGLIPEWAANYSTYVAGGPADNPFGDGGQSAWITYATPTPNVPDQTGETFQYELKFIAAANGLVGLNFLSDNVGTVYLNGVTNPAWTNAGNPQLGSSGVPNTEAVWMSSPIDFDVFAGTAYTLDLDITNFPDGPSNNPTGVRVDLADPPLPTVPDHASTLLLLGIAAGGVVGLRRLIPRQSALN
jgi:hypothetical protein